MHALQAEWRMDASHGCPAIPRVASHRGRVSNRVVFRLNCSQHLCYDLDSSTNSVLVVPRDRGRFTIVARGPYDRD